MEERKITLPLEWRDWEVVRILGRGSFGAVYEIRRQLPGAEERAALKVVTIPQSRSEIRALESDGYDAASITAHFRSYLETLVREYALMNEIKGHTNIVYCDTLKYIQHDDGVGWDVYIKMELLTPMTDYLKGDIDESQAVKLGIDICSALIHCGSRNIIHRDVKPQNIFVSRDGSFKLGDFGIAKVVEKTVSGTKVGTYNYMAPEVYKAEPYGQAADQYSLGLVLYWMLNQRRLPFLPLPPEVPSVQQGEKARERRFRGEALPEPVHGSQALKRIVLKACAYDPGDRFGSLEEMRHALESLSDATVGMFHTADAWERLRKAQEQEAREKELQRQQEQERLRLERLRLEQRRMEEENARRQALLEQERLRREAEEKKKRQRLALTVGGGVLALALLVLAFFNVHFWTEGSCTQPVECSLCGKVRREAPGHSWSAGSCTEARVCLVCGAPGAQAPGHRWLEATCTQPKTCEVCGYAESGAAGHQWQEATCTERRTCGVCGTQEGAALGHQWQEATAAAPRTCLRCGEAVGRPLGVSVTGCAIVNTTNELGDDIVNGTWKDILGNSLENAARFWVKKLPGWSETEEITYDLGGRYGVLDIWLALGADSREGTRVRFRVYGDGELLCETVYMDRQTDPCRLELDVRDVASLTVVCETDSPADAYGLMQGTLYIE